MSQSVIIKSNKYGLNLILDPDMPFEELLEAVIGKFKESEKFFKDSKLGISFEGRELSKDEEYRIIDAITDNTSINILCVVDNNEENAAHMKAQIDAFKEQVEQQVVSGNNGSGEFYKGMLRSGQVIESEASITILGDVNPGAKVISGGNIVVLGALKGNAHAGAFGNKECFIFALNMEPIQLQIAELIAKSPDKQRERRRLIRKDREKETTAELQVAVARDGAICIEPVTKQILNTIAH